MMVSRDNCEIRASYLAPGLKPFVSFGILLGLLTLPMESQGTEYVVGVAGRHVELPCRLHNEEPPDRAILALWYIQGRRLPVYSYDARGSSGLFQPDEVLSGRSSFETSEDPARLVLDPVLASDEAVYTCRVDFRSSPTLNTVVNLTVIEPPKKLSVYDSENGVVRRRIGPINEGSPLSLSCVVVGGRPPPTVTWWSERVLEERRSEVTREGHIRSELKISEVSRAFHLKTFTCQAQNNNQEKPLMQDVTIDMNLRPLSVRIRTPVDPLIAGRQYSFTCESQGSKPPASIKWFEEGGEVEAIRTHTRPGAGDVTTGVLTMVPSQSDDGKKLKCQASNPSVPGSAISDSVTLNVHYAPIVELEMGKNLVANSIKQGDDVYFECRFRANPDPYRVTWEKNSEEVRPNQTAGVIMSGNSLVLQQVERSSAGEYTCSATNSQGTQLSNPVGLDIMYPPECIVDQPTVLAVGRGERVNISCHVASNPPRATFHWRLNGSERTYTSKGDSLPWGHLVSHYTFVGASDKDYGALLCWANNSIGVQDKPCVFQIIPAGPPSSPEHCEIANNTADNIEVLCERGFDGGMRQTFLAEVYDEGGALHLNRSSGEPHFSVESLRPGTTYSIRVSAFNGKGRSPPVALTAATLKVAEQRVGENKSLFYSPLIIIFLSIVGVFLTLIVILVFVTRWRKNNNSSSGPSSTGRPEGGPRKEEEEEEEEEGGGGEEEGGGGGEEERGGDGKENGGGESQKTRAKKKVVIENGTKERLPLGGVVQVGSAKDALLGREAFASTTAARNLSNGSAGYYDSLGKTTIAFPSVFPTSSTASSTSTSSTALPRPHAAASSSLGPYHPPTTSSSSSSSSSSFFSSFGRHPEALPRRGRRAAEGYYDRAVGEGVAAAPSQSYVLEGYRAGAYLSGREPWVLVEEEEEVEVEVEEGSGSGLPATYRSGRGGGEVAEEEYRLLEEVKGDPKYVVRTRQKEAKKDESFV